jgi:hypothetical protein
MTAAAMSTREISLAIVAWAADGTRDCSVVTGPPPPDPVGFAAAGPAIASEPATTTDSTLPIRALMRVLSVLPIAFSLCSEPPGSPDCLVNARGKPAARHWAAPYMEGNRTLFLTRRGGLRLIIHPMIREPDRPPFIGRRAELEMLTSALSDAADGHPRAVFVAGEAGVGKSRLVSHFLSRPATRGTWRMSGACVDVSGESLPYGPIRDALRSFVGNVTDRDRTRVIDSVPATLQALLPESSGDRVPGSEGSAPQVLTFEAVLDLIAEAAAVRPLLIVLEDLHWADSSSLACLNFLLARLRSERALIVGTYRSDELHRTHPLRPWMAEQLHKDIVRLIDLPRFNRSESEKLVEAVIGNKPPPDISVGIYERSEGNAFFIEELSRTAPGRDAALPMTLREILLARIRNLPDEVQALLRIATVGGRSSTPMSCRRSRARITTHCSRCCARLWRATYWRPRPAAVNSASAMHCSMRSSFRRYCRPAWSAQPSSIAIPCRGSRARRSETSPSSRCGRNAPTRATT